MRASLMLVRALPIALVAAGCNMTQLAVETQADVMELAYPSIEAQADYEFARRGIPANLVQIEGLLRVQPENEKLLLLAAQGFASYAYGFVEDEMQQAELAGDLERSDRQRARARAMYLKARDYGLSLLGLMSSDFPTSLPRDPDVLKRTLEATFGDPEDAPALFWTGNSWCSAVNVSRDDPGLVADLPTCTVFVERALELDEAYYNAAGHVLLGVANASLGESMGGDPEKGREHFERALALTSRKALLVQVNYAEAYAVQKQDKELFTGLLEEAVAAENPGGSPLALPNAVAQRRARRLLSQADTLILEPLPDAPAEQNAPETVEKPPAGSGAGEAPAAPAGQGASSSQKKRGQ